MIWLIWLIWLYIGVVIGRLWVQSLLLVEN